MTTQVPPSMVDPAVLPSKLSGDVVQTVTSATGAVATGTTQVPLDDTIPQSTEGDQYLSATITPTSASNTLEVTTTLVCSPSVVCTVIAALFQDAGASAVAVAMGDAYTGTARMTLTFVHYLTAGTTSATTLKVRAGPSTAATLTVNGISGARYMGGVLSSRITVRELKV